MQPSELKIPTLEDFPPKGPNSLASIGQRATGRIIDMVVMSIPAIILVLPFVRVDGDDVKAEIPTWVGFVALMLVIAYEAVAIAWRGQTVGKWVMGLRVARFVDGKRATPTQATMRILLPACFVAIPIPIVDTGWLIVYLSSMYNPLRRGWHDKAGGTIVVRTR